MDKNGLMYFVDATMIRKVDQNGIISTLIKTNDLTAVRPLSCDSSMDVSQVSRETWGARKSMFYMFIFWTYRPFGAEHLCSAAEASRCILKDISIPLPYGQIH